MNMRCEYILPAEVFEVLKLTYQNLNVSLAKLNYGKESVTFWRVRGAKSQSRERNVSMTSPCWILLADSAQYAGRKETTISV